MTNQEIQIDESLYSRQIYVLGLEAMKKMSNSSVLISGIGGLGIEIAKNIVLAGVRNVTIHDTKLTTISDLGSQFYLTESDIGQNRAKCSISKLSELNQYVICSAETCDLSCDFLSKFNTVVISDFRPLKELIRISNFCRSKKINFIATQSAGVFSYVFDDFGEKFLVTEPSAEIPSRFLIENITHDEKGIVTIGLDDSHNLDDSNLVRFEEVPGMTELNGKTLPIKVINTRKFSIGDTRSFSPYEFSGSGGYGNQIFQPIEVTFKSFEESIISPPVIDADFNNFGRDRQTLLGFLSFAYYSDLYPNQNPVDNLEEYFSIVKKFNEKNQITQEIDFKIVELVARHTNFELSPMSAVFGGIVGQEILKSLSGKFIPINQFYTLAYVEAIPNDFVCGKPIGDRYDSYRVVFGDEQQEKMMNLKYFMIGSGAIGCEVLKNLAMMGVSTGAKGLLTVTDMDSIEKSNLSRQFLFRDKDIGKMKSESAKLSILNMNKNMKIEAQTNKLAPDTKDIYSDEFYLQLDGVCNALDNVEARRYSDSQCVYYKKPLLESGTLGPMANFQIVVPYMTESYSSSVDPPEKTIPQCTVHNFPSNIDHCCQWARDIFSGLFEQDPETVNKFLKRPDIFINELTAQGNSVLLDNLKKLEPLIVHRPKKFSDCILIARKKFETLFNWRIRDLLSLYPVDYQTNGVYFWTGAKRPPTPLEFDINNPIHYEFVLSYSLILARIYGIGSPEKSIKELILEANPGPYIPEILEEEIDNKIVCETDSELNKLIQELYSKNHGIKSINVEKFEKDDDSNSHMDFIYSASNLRALNYKINIQTKLEIKRIAGKIIPAISTTTAMICGFVCLEMYKLHSITPKKIIDYRSGFINLAISMFSLSEPISCSFTKIPTTGQSISLWDSFQIKGDLTINDFIQYVKDKYNLVVKSIGIGDIVLFAIFLPIKKRQERLNQKISILFEELNKKPIPKNQFWLKVDAVCYTEDKIEIKTSPFILQFKD